MSRTKPQKIVYWSQVLFPKTLNPETFPDDLNTALGYLITHDYNRAQLKQKQFGITTLWTINLNAKHRAIFTAAIFNGVRVL